MMTTKDNESDMKAGNDLMKAIGSLDSATADLKQQAKSGSSLSTDDEVNILTIIGRAILKIFGN